MKPVFGAVVCLLLAAPFLPSHPGPFDGKTFHGRIAWSADGNHNDEDDWAASPAALAIFARFGVKDKLVHFDYNSILNHTDPAWEKQHETSVLGAADRYRYPRRIFHDCQKDLDGAIRSLARAIDESSAGNPLYLVIAGPMEVAYRAILKSDPARRRFVYAISHSRWNDGFSTTYTYNFNKRSVIPSGVHWVQIRDQNAFLSTSPYGRPARPEEWRPWEWMRDSPEADVRFLWERMQATGRADCSDAGMAYFVVSGDEEPEIGKVRRLLKGGGPPAPLDPRQQVRLEAENFLSIDGCDLIATNRAASHRLSVRAKGSGAVRIRTPFDEPYAAAAARYDIQVRYFDGKAGSARLALFVNGSRAGDAWQASADGEAWQVRTVADVAVKAGDEIAVEVEGASGPDGELDYVQLNLRDAGPARREAR